MHRVSWIGDAAAIAAAIDRWHELDGRRVEKELRRHAARGVCRKREKPAPDPHTRRGGRRRLLSQRWQALGLAKRSGVASAEGVDYGGEQIKVREKPGTT